MHLLSKIIGSLHLCGMVIESIYGIIPTATTANKMDTIYLLSFVSLPFSWILCKDECVISYVLKKYKNPEYQLGNEPENSNDISDLFPNINSFSIFQHTNHILRIGSVILVNNRLDTSIPYSILTPVFVMYTFYVYDIHYKWDFRYQFYPYFHLLFSIYLFRILCHLFSS